MITTFVVVGIVMIVFACILAARTEIHRKTREPNGVEDRYFVPLRPRAHHPDTAGAQHLFKGSLQGEKQEHSRTPPGGTTLFKPAGGKEAPEGKRCFVTGFERTICTCGTCASRRKKA